MPPPLCHLIRRWGTTAQDRRTSCAPSTSPPNPQVGPHHPPCSTAARCCRQSQTQGETTSVAPNARCLPHPCAPQTCARASPPPPLPRPQSTRARACLLKLLPRQQRMHQTATRQRHPHPHPMTMKGVTLEPSRSRGRARSGVPARVEAPLCAHPTRSLSCPLRRQHRARGEGRWGGEEGKHAQVATERT